MQVGTVQREVRRNVLNFQPVGTGRKVGKIRSFRYAGW